MLTAADLDFLIASAVSTAKAAAARSAPWSNDDFLLDSLSDRGLSLDNSCQLSTSRPISSGGGNRGGSELGSRAGAGGAGRMWGTEGDRYRRRAEPRAENVSSSGERRGASASSSVEAGLGGRGRAVEAGAVAGAAAAGVGAPVESVESGFRDASRGLRAGGIALATTDSHWLAGASSGPHTQPGAAQVGAEISATATATPPRERRVDGVRGEGGKVLDFECRS
jgi:hypothetical protein